MLGKIFDGKSCSRKLKAAIQRTGKLGFTQDTIEELKLDKQTYCIIAEDTDSKLSFYLGVLRQDSQFAFEVMKSGSYFFLNTRALFNQLEFDYKNNVYIFDITRCAQFDDEIGGECYKMVARVKPRLQTDNENA